MTNPTAIDDDYTVEELLGLDDEDFIEAVTDDLKVTTSYNGPFQDPQVCRRTLHALIERVWFIDSVLERRADDPTYPIERFEATQAFKRHLLAAVDLTQNRIMWGSGIRAREVSAWKNALHEVCDELEGGPESELLDDLKIPFENLTLRNWLAIRRVKDPSRVKVRDVA